MNKKEELTQKYISECITYDSETGIAVWKLRPINHFKNENSWKISIGKCAGKEIKSPNSDGYYRIYILGKRIALHRVIWLYVYGYLPEEVDHINGKKNDNRLINLREVSHKENSHNQKRHCTNTSGVAGVSFHKRLGKWQSRITVQDIRIHLGYFE